MARRSQRSIDARIARQGVRMAGTGQTLGGPQSPLAGSGAPGARKATTDTGSALERHLAASLRAGGLPEPAREFRFHPPRMWRVDFAFVEQRLAVEIEGGIYRGGAHTTVDGLRRDIEKSNQLMLDGWRLLRVHGDQVRSGEAVALIARALGMEAP